MLVFPNCKINLGLNILRKRTDGFHDLETIFYPVPWCDALEVIESRTLQFFASGFPVPGDPQNNLCLKAWHILKKDFPKLPPVDIYLHKSIPMGAGLGGGSSDGAHMLQLLNEKFQLGLSQQQLITYALQLGSDCPFFIKNQPAFATSRGEMMEAVDLSLKGYQLLLVNPGIHVPTKWAFEQITPKLPLTSLKILANIPATTWQAVATNDFEPPVVANYPELAVLKKQLIDSGAVYAAMSGSGSTFFGIFAKTVHAKDFKFPAHYTVKAISL